jgi:CRP/FNR family transcriptional regulator
MPNEKEERKVVRFSTNDHFFKQYERSKDLYILKSGKVKIYKTEGEYEVELGIVETGGVVGEVAAIDGGWRSASAIALEDAEAFVVTYKEFQNTLKTIPEWFYKIAKILVQRLREVDEKIDTCVGGDKSPHIAAILGLMTCSNKCIKRDEKTFEINGKFLENELVDILNLNLSDIGKSLSKLQEDGYIQVEGNSIIVSDRDQLDTYADYVFEETEETPAT